MTRARDGGPRLVDPQLLRHARAARASLALTVAMSAVATGLVIGQAALVAHALATVTRGTANADLPVTLAALFAVVVGRSATAYSSEAAALRAAAAVKSKLRRELAAHALRLGPTWADSQRPGELATLATRGLDGLDAYFGRYLPQLALAALTPAAVLLTVVTQDWISAALIALTLPLIPLFAALVGWHTRARTGRQWQLLARLGGHFLDAVQGLPTLKVFGRAKPQADQIARVTDAHRRATMSSLRVAFLSALVLELAATLATALVAVEVGLRLLGGHIGYQTALFVLLLTPEAFLPLRNLGAQYHASAEGTVAAGRILDILRIPPVISGSRRPRLGSIEVNEVTLAYRGTNHPAIDRLSLTMHRGEHVVLTGHSGAGKTSLLRLLLRFTEPSAGSVLVDGEVLGDLDPVAWRELITWVPQHPHLFAGTVADNIALGQPRASTAAITRAAHLAGASDFIAELPQGYRTQIGERGLRLSAGQRQMIALARAFLRDARLWLLDEPTAHLDPGQARRARAGIETLTQGRTLILVTHDPGTAPRDARVVTLQDGRLAASAAVLAGVAGQ